MLREGSRSLQQLDADMHINAMLVTEYATATGPHKCGMVRNPDWNEIEAAVRRLERCRFPFVWFYRSADAFDDEVPDLEVVGGRGEYAIKAYQCDGSVLSVVDVQRTRNRVDIWESDQGWSLPENELCPDLEKALRIVRLFCETGEMHSEAEWMDTSIPASKH